MRPTNLRHINPTMADKIDGRVATNHRARHVMDLSRPALIDPSLLQRVSKTSQDDATTFSAKS
jgi:hypothetical protein